MKLLENTNTKSMSAIRNKINVSLMLLFCASSFAQVTTTPVLVGSGGTFGTNSATGSTLSGSVGEPATLTLSPTVGTATIQHLTQGFQQPLSGSLKTAITVTNATCIGLNDGSLTVTVLEGKGPFTYKWFKRYNMETEASTQTNTGLAGSLNLTDKYLVEVTDARGFKKLDSAFVGFVKELDCSLKIFSGVSPNGDGSNDKWYMENVQLFPDNEVKIFNRYGDKLWEGRGYDNNTVVWAAVNKQGDDLPDGTYFYIVKVTTAGRTTKYEGWVEITK